MIRGMSRNGGTIAGIELYARGYKYHFAVEAFFVGCGHELIEVVQYDEVAGPIDMVKEIDEFGEAHAFEADANGCEVGGTGDGAAAVIDTGPSGEAPVADGAVNEGEQVESRFCGQFFAEDGLFFTVPDDAVVDGLGLFEAIAGLFEFLFGFLKGLERTFADEVRDNCKGGNPSADQHSAFAIL